MSKRNIGFLFVVLKVMSFNFQTLSLLKKLPYYVC